MTGTNAIDGVVWRPLRVIEDARGAVLHMFRDDSPLSAVIHEVYFSEIQPSAVKAWKRHRRMTQRLAVPVGRVDFVLYDDRDGSPTRGGILRMTMGRPDAYGLLVIPPGVWYGWRNVHDGPSLIANCADLLHDPAESENIEALEALANCWSTNA
jgi:dTDP-4-dehydrorhamnose 3,5-epimerase